MERVHDYRKRIASEFLRTTNRKYELYFKLYDQLVTDSGVYILQVDQPEPNDPPLQSVTMMFLQQPPSFEETRERLYIKLHKISRSS